jgi:hypothetical protein
MANVILSNGAVAIVDDSDFDKLSKHKWFPLKIDRSGTCAIANIRDEQGVRRCVRMNRLIMGAKHGEIIDHKNRDTLDNRRCNLRVSTVGQNRSNSKLPENSSTGFKGVHKVNGCIRWHARIRASGKLIVIGLFDSPEDAAAAYDEMATKLFGEFACTNKSLGLLK